MEGVSNSGCFGRELNWRHPERVPHGETVLLAYLFIYPGIRLKRLRNTTENRGQHSPCFFGPEDGSSTFLRVVGELVPDYTAAHDPRSYTARPSRDSSVGLASHSLIDKANTGGGGF
jgi:hypothetical protein